MLLLHDITKDDIAKMYAIKGMVVSATPLMVGFTWNPENHIEIHLGIDAKHPMYDFAVELFPSYLEQNKGRNSFDILSRADRET